MTRGRLVPFIAVISTAVMMWLILMFMAQRAYAATTYPPPPPSTHTIPPPADTGFEGSHDALAAGVLGVVGVGSIITATAVARRRAKEFRA